MRSDVGYEVGQHNVQVLGLDINKPVFLISAALVVAFVIGTLLFLDTAGAAFSEMRVWITTRFDCALGNLLGAAWYVRRPVLRSSRSCHRTGDENLSVHFQGHHGTSACTSYV